MNKKQNVGILHGVDLYIYFQDIWQTCWIDDKKWHLKLFYMHENAKFVICRFSKVMQQHTYGNLILVLLEIYCSLQQWKNFAYQPKIDKVIAMVTVAPFWLTVYVHFMNDTGTLSAYNLLNTINV